VIKLVDYKYSGSGKVTVSPSKGQTGGSGFGSQGTYGSEAAARSAVSSGTREGAIQPVQTEQQKGGGGSVSTDVRPPLNPSGLLQPISSSGSSGSLGSSAPVLDSGFRQELGISELLQSAAVETSKTPILTARLQGSTGYDPYANIQGITGEEYLASLRASDQLADIRKAAPLTVGLYERSAELSAGLQKGFEGLIGYSETAHPVKKVFVGAGSLVTGLPQMVGMTAVVGEFAIRKPAELPTALQKGMPMFGGQLVEQATTHPWETAGMVAGMIAGPKIVKSVGERLPAVKVRGIEVPSAKGFIDNVKAVNRPAMSWKQFKTGKGLVGEYGAGMTQELATTTGGKHTMLNIKASPVMVAPVAAGMTYQGLSIEHGRKAQPLIGITDQPVTNLASFQIGGKTIVAGTPRFAPESIPDMFGGRFGSEAGYREFMSPTEYTIATKNILPTYDAPTQELFQATISKRQLTYGMKSTHALSDVQLEDVFERHGLKSETAQNLRSYMQKQKEFVIWGSTANKAQVMGEGGVGYFREIHDIDIHVKNPLQTTQEMFNIISKTERPGFVTMKGGGLATSKGHLFDIKTIEGGLPEEWALSSSELPGKGNVFLFPGEKPVKLGKFSVQSLSDQATSKLSSIGLRTKTISAAAHRAGKDPFDLVYVNEPSLTMDMAKSWNPFKRLAGGEAKALDIQIQGLTESKIRAQPIGDLPGQITAQQKNLFFENLEAMRAGRAVVTTPRHEVLYQAKPRSYGYQPATSGLLAGMISGGSRASVSSSMQQTAKRTGLSMDISKQSSREVRKPSYYPASKTVGSGSGLSFPSTPKPKPLSPVISHPGSGRSPQVSIPRSPAYQPPRSPQVLSPPAYRQQPKVNYPKISPPRSPPSTFMTIRVREPKPIKFPSSKLTVNLPKGLKAKGYGKFPEIARVAAAGRVLGLKFPWEEEKKKKSRSSHRKRKR